MATFKVKLKAMFIGTAEVEVEAYDEEEAMDIALEDEKYDPSIADWDIDTYDPRELESGDVECIRPTPPCYYNSEECSGEVWQCSTCKEWYCDFHSHGTGLGHNVECVACESARKEREAEEANDGTAGD